MPALIVCLCATAFLVAQAPAPSTQQSVSEELQTAERTLAELQALKNDLQDLSTRVDSLIGAWSERKGRLQNARPAPFGGIAAGATDRPDPRPPVVRCAAITKEGTRCTRAAQTSQRYCAQHVLAKQK